MPLPHGRSVERSPERDVALLAVLPYVAEHGWTTRALRLALADLRQTDAQTEFLFQGATDMIEAYLDLADRRMSDAAAALVQTRRSERVRALIAMRLHQADAERPALRRATALLALPVNAAAAARTLARTTDAIWHAAGDQSADFSWYTKRATLAAVYSATVLYWLRHDSWSGPEKAITLAFLDRRLGDVARLGRLRARMSERLQAMIPARLREHPPTRDLVAKRALP
jgi:ubiquinone biosynthesis protein COQ9